ncbi:MAG: hypothetical protein RQ867_07940 [Mariprofundaceae bacterium]|nr:hypothetical protein [Mariprofundaceae bacterium]
MQWQTSFHIAHLCIEIRSNTDLCRSEMQSIISLYEPTTADAPDILFSFEKHGDTFTLSTDGTILWQSRDSRDFPPALEIHLYRLAVELMAPRLLSLHASAVSVHDRACIFAGISGAGKSSICTAALLNGGGYLTDEFTLLDGEGMVHPFPRPLQWDTAEHPAFTQHDLLNKGLFSNRHYSFPDPDGNIITSNLWLPARVQHQPLQAAWIILPQYDADAPAAELLVLRRSEALMQLPGHLHRQMPPAASLKELNRRIPNTTGFFTLRFSDVHAAWESVSQAISN